MSPRCPRCSAEITATPDAQGFVVCAGCSARLRSRAGEPASSPVPVAVPAPGAPAAGLDALLAEIRAMRQSQDQLVALQREILAAVQSQGEAGAPGARSESSDELSAVFPELSGEEPGPPPPPRPVRRRRKSVLVIDDDEAARQEAVAAMEGAQVPVRAVGDGHAALGAIAAEKPDVIAIELGLGGAMPGKDVINMIKATMEWVDIPIVLYTGVPVDGQKEARTIHGADELVRKGPGAPERLVAQVIQIFQRG